MANDRQIMFPLSFDLLLKYLPPEIQLYCGKEFSYSASDMQEIEEILLDAKEHSSSYQKAESDPKFKAELIEEITSDAHRTFFKVKLENGETCEILALGILLKYGTAEIKSILSKKITDNELEPSIADFPKVLTDSKKFTEKDLLKLVIATNITFMEKKESPPEKAPMQGGSISIFEHISGQIFAGIYGFGPGANRALDQMKTYEVRKDKDERLDITFTLTRSLSANEGKYQGVVKLTQPYFIESRPDGSVKIAYNEAAVSRASRDPKNFPISISEALWEAGVIEGINKILEIREKDNPDKKAEFNEILPFTPFLQHPFFREEFLIWRSTLDKTNRKTVDSDIEKYFKPFPTILRSYKRQKFLLPWKLLPRWAKWGITTAIILTIFSLIVISAWIPAVAPLALKFGSMIASALGFSTSNSILAIIGAAVITLGSTIIAAITGKISSMIGEARRLAKVKSVKEESPVSATKPSSPLNATPPNQNAKAGYGPVIPEGTAFYSGEQKARRSIWEKKRLPFSPPSTIASEISDEKTQTTSLSPSRRPSFTISFTGEEQKYEQPTTPLSSLPPSPPNEEVSPRSSDSGSGVSNVSLFHHDTGSEHPQVGQDQGENPKPSSLDEENKKDPHPRNIVS